MTDQRILLRRVIAALGRYRYRMSNEDQLQRAIAEGFVASKLAFEREYAIGSSRFDFLVEGSIVVEVKVDGTFSQAFRQVARYVEHDFVTAVVIATSKRWTLAPGEATLQGKPIELVNVRGRMF